MIEDAPAGLACDGATGTASSINAAAGTARNFIMNSALNVCGPVRSERTSKAKVPAILENHLPWLDAGFSFAHGQCYTALSRGSGASVCLADIPEQSERSAAR